MILEHKQFWRKNIAKLLRFLMATDG